jgi:hypothetical protein
VYHVCACIMRFSTLTQRTPGSPFGLLVLRHESLEGLGRSVHRGTAPKEHHTRAQAAQVTLPLLTQAAPLAEPWGERRAHRQERKLLPCTTPEFATYGGVDQSGWL